MKPPAVAEPSNSEHRLSETGAKSMAIEIIRSQPPDIGLDDVLRALGFHRVVQRGLADAAAGRVMSQEAFRRKMQSWLD